MGNFSEPRTLAYGCDWQTLVRKSFLISLLNMSSLFPLSISAPVALVCGGVRGACTHHNFPFYKDCKDISHLE